MCPLRDEKLKYYKELCDEASEQVALYNMDVRSKLPEKQFRDACVHKLRLLQREIYEVGQFAFRDNELRANLYN